MLHPLWRWLTALGSSGLGCQTGNDAHPPHTPIVKFVKSWTSLKYVKWGTLSAAGLRGDDVRQPDRRLRVQARLRRRQVQRLPGRHARRGRRLQEQRQQRKEEERLNNQVSLSIYYHFWVDADSIGSQFRRR